MQPIRLAVRGVVEHVLRCGDIDNRQANPSAMLLGARAHRKLQATMMTADNYQKEVSLSLNLTLCGIPVVLHGRADGVITENGGYTIDEIKTTAAPLDSLAQQKELHLGQAKCYAHMLLNSLQSPPERISVRLTYHQLQSGETTHETFAFTARKLQSFFDGLLDAYGVWLRFEQDWRTTRDLSIRAAGFPFGEYRAGQRKLAAQVYTAIDRQKKLYAEAPTGIGKTLSVLFPAIKAMGESKSKKLFYLTAKTITRGAAEDAVKLMATAGLRCKSVTLRAKNKICFLDDPQCNPDCCEAARGHYDRVNAALLELLQRHDIITPDIVEDCARRHLVCPHELALDASQWADLCVCDYNHVFDPTSYLYRFFSDAGEYTFLIDEAHNLLDRVRDMYTASLYSPDFDRFKRALRGRDGAVKKLRKALTQTAAHLTAKKELLQPGTHVEAQQDGSLTLLVESACAAFKEWLPAAYRSGQPPQSDMLDFFFSLQTFSLIASGYGEHYATITDVSGGVTLTLFCLDPSEIIREKLALAKASILFSATITPLPYYRDILGGDGEDGMIALPSPFDSRRLLLLAHCGISTKYADRSDSVPAIAETIYTAVSGRRGNYLIFCPSYEYMQAIYNAFRERYPCVSALLQHNAMNERERADFLSRFGSQNDDTLLGFCVLGGIFSEGIDLAGDRLIGSIVVGVGLPKLSIRQNLIRDYFEAKNGHGYDYAYTFPGMNKVMQASGRVIRQESDKGIVLLIDSRFNTATYRALYPAHWAHIRTIKSTAELERHLSEFWQCSQLT